jgi:hypothetical protein
VTEQYPESATPDSPEASGETAETQTAEGQSPPADTGGQHHLEVAHTSALEDPVALAEGLGDAATGDIVIDSALEDLQQVPDDDLDAQIEAGQRVHDTLKSRLSDLGGE